MKPPARKGAKKKRFPWGKLLAHLTLWPLLVGVLGVSALFTHYGRDLPSIDKLRKYQPPQTTRVLDRKGRVLGELFEERRTVIPMSKIPPHMLFAVMAAEDADFYKHEGLDYPGILRAIAKAVIAGHPTQGGSTITQQIVKLLLLSPERTLRRKVRELILARRIEQELTKDEILHLYLNHVNFGHGRYGVEEASRFYFGKSAIELSLAEAALLAGIPQSPTHLSPRTHPEAAKARQTFVFDQLEEKRPGRWPEITVAKLTAARNEEITLIPRPDTGSVAPEIVELAKRTLRERVGEDAIKTGGYTIYTTIDLDAQRSARAAVRKGLEDLDKREGFAGPLRVPAKAYKPRKLKEPTIGKTYVGVVVRTDDTAGTVEVDIGGPRAIVDVETSARYNKKHLEASRFAPRGATMRISITGVDLTRTDGNTPRYEGRLELGPEGAAVLLDVRSRDVLALVGSYEAVSGWNRATQAIRQPGSTFKPIVYALAIRKRRYMPGSLVVDAPATYDQWQPQNYETWHYQGIITLRKAVAESINSVAVRVIEELTPQLTAAFAHELGLTTPMDPSLPLALGASDVHPIELVNVYATFAAGGTFNPTHIVTRISGPGGTEIPMPALEPARAVLSPAEAYLVTSMLKSVVETGTGTGAARLGRPCAGKTGTSNNARDAWFVGYTPDLAGGVWVGFDDGKSLGRRENGARAALPVWVEMLKQASRGRPATDFVQPEGVVSVLIDPNSAMLAYEGMPGAVNELFLTDAVPVQSVLPPDAADPNVFLLDQMARQMGDPEPMLPPKVNEQVTP